MQPPRPPKRVVLHLWVFLSAASLCARAGLAGPPPSRTVALQAAPRRGLVIVEGHLDARAVRRAVREAIVIHTNGKGLLDGKSGADRVLVSRVQQAGAVPVVLTDPDLTGLELRSRIDRLLDGRCFHAFLPVHLARLTAETPTLAGDAWYKEIDDVGIQHAAPEAIVRALRAARRSDAARVEFDAESLVAMGVAAAFDSPDGHGAGARRRALCDALGLGQCTGKVLLKQLNCYGFTRAEVEATLRRVGAADEVGGGGGGGVPVARVPAVRVRSSPLVVEAASAPSEPLPAPPAARSAPPAPLAPPPAAAAALAPPPPPPRAPAVADPPPPATAAPIAHPKVVRERTGSMPLQYAGPKPHELLQLYNSALSAGTLGGDDDDDDDDWDDDDWEEVDDDGQPF